MLIYRISSLYLPPKNRLSCSGIRSTSRSSPAPSVTAASPGWSQNGTTPSPRTAARPRPTPPASGPISQLALPPARRRGRDEAIPSPGGNPPSPDGVVAGMAGTATRTANPRERPGQREKGSRAVRVLARRALVGALPQRGRARRAWAACDPEIVRVLGMTETAVSSQPSLMGYFAYWIRQLRLADELPSALANRLVRAAIQQPRRPVDRRQSRRRCSNWPPTTTRPSTAATSSAGCGCGGFWATTRACSTRQPRGTGIGNWGLRPARAGHAGRGPAARSRTRPNRGVLAAPRRVAAFGDHPAWTHAYLRSADFKAMLAAADDPKLGGAAATALPWPTSDDAWKGARPVTFLP